MLPYGNTRPQWLNSLVIEKCQNFDFKWKFLPAYFADFLWNCTAMDANNHKSTLVQVTACSGRNEIWDALVLRTSSRAFALVRTRVLLVRKKVQILVYNSPARPKAILRKEERWLTDVGHNSWRHMKSAQHAAHNPKFEKLGLFRHARWWRLKDKRTHIPGWW